MPTGRFTRMTAPPPPLNTYPTDSLQNLRDAVITQSRRALELSRECKVPTP